MTMTSTGAARGVDAKQFGLRPIVSIDGAALPATEAARVLSLEVSSVINRPDMCEVRLAHESDSQGTAAQALPAKFKLGATMKVEVPAGSAKEVLFDGEITSFDYVGSNRGPTEVILLAYDKRHRLYRGDKNEVHKRKKIEEILKSAVTEVGLSFESINLPSTVLPYFLRTGSAGDLLDYMCARYGLMTMTDGNKVVVAELSQWADVVGELEANSSMLDYRFRATSDSDLIGGDVTVRGWDVYEKEAIVGTSDRAAGLPSSVEQVKEGPFPAAPVHLSKVVVDRSEANDIAKGVARQNLDAGMQMDATCTLQPKLRAGKLVEVKSVPAPFAGKYRLTEVRHVFDQVEGTRTVVICRGADDPTLVGLLTEGRSAGANWGEMSQDWALRPAIVSDIKGDGSSGGVGDAGEVKVKLPWLGDQIESDWLRVASLGAGKDRGLLMMPEVNDEVLVAFQGGDHRAGFVLGGLWNGKDPTPRPATKWGDERGFRSRTGQEIIVNDTSGEEQILIQSADKAMYLKIEKSGDLITIGGKDILIKNTGKTTIESDGEISMKSKADFKLEANNITLKGQMKVDIQAGTQATMKGTAGAEVSGLKVDIKADTAATVKGNPIMLN